MLSDSGKELAKEVLVHGPITRTELGSRLRLSPASLTRLSKPLLDAGFLVELDEAPGPAPGRPARPLDIRPGMGRFLGVKLTGDVAHGVVTDLRAGVTGQLQRHLTSREPEAVAKLIAGVAHDLGVVPPARGGAPAPALFGVGICLGGMVRRARQVVRAPFLGWQGVPLADLVEEASGLPAVVANDVVALSAAHHWFGLAKGETDFAVITTGAGVGYGLVTRGRVIDTAEAGIGLAGHLPLDDNGPACPEGWQHRGCAMSILASGPMVARAERELGRKVDYDQLLTLAVAGEAVAAQIVGDAARALGRLIALAANLTLRPLVVLGGEGMGLWDVAAPQIRAAAESWRQAEAEPLRIMVDATGFVSWARGAAALAIQESVGRLG
ncbi:MAG: ROK family transcriptional regulator [Bifidobacteriaceae bacterium]|nr:ROK family transcriptional regulator [Bifidobacteriaceae bacterium]